MLQPELADCMFLDLFSGSGAIGIEALSPQFLDLNVKLNYTFVLHDHIKLQLNTGVQNIFNSFQKDLDKGEFRDAGYFYGPTQPRTFFVGFKIMN